MSEQPDSLFKRRWPLFLLAAAVAIAAISGASMGFFLRLDLPDVHALQDYSPPVMSRVLAADRSVVDTFAEQRRVLIDYREIPKSFIEALIATEDKNFHEHTGIDAQGIFRAAWSDLRNLRLSQGASTLTMQLARALFLHREKTFRRKAQEAVLALEIERNYTKEEILRFYCNQVYMGHGRYGLEAASRYYFNKPAIEMNLSESALMAGLIQRPEALTPVRHRQRALKRRNHVLSRMVHEGYLTPEEARQAGAAPIELARNRSEEKLAPFFVEEVRRWLKSKYGDSSVYQEGLEVHTTLDPVLQRKANRAMDYGLRQLDKRQGWRGVQGRVPDGEDLYTWKSPSWKNGIGVGKVHDAVVLVVDDREARVRLGRIEGVLDKKAISWTRRKKPSSFLRPGDLIRVRLVKRHEDGTVKLTLEQEPIAEAALVAIDHATGEVKAMVGGFDFQRSEWNRVTQAKRQTGSAFKPFVYAAALANGWNLADRIMDEPTVFLDPYIGEPYQPENYTNKYYGNLTIRRALEKSANIATVKLLHQVGYQEVIDLAHKMGIQSRLHPFPSLALGSFEVSLMELTSAYGTFANQGVRVDPYLVAEVRDRDGALLDRIEPQVHDALSPQIAYLINHCLEGVVTDGTGRAAASIGRPLAGKTGTTDDNTDAWFIGYTPGLSVGVWVGFDDNSSLGSRETGALAALPIWKQFMELANRGLPPEDFEPPRGITFQSIDRGTGLKANPSARCSPVYSEAFVEGTEPTKYCSHREHALRNMPYPLQRYAFNERGLLEISEKELDYILSTDLSIHLNRNGKKIVARASEKTTELSLSMTPGGSITSVPERLQARLSETEWFGKDGRRARIILLER